MPKLGLTMEEGSIERWLRKEGDDVTEGEVILEIMTDKVAAEVEAPTSGVLGPLLFPEGTTVPVGQVITYVVAPGEELPRSEPPSTKEEVAFEKTEASIGKPGTPAVVRRADRRQVKVSPRARRLADELGIDLSTVVGTGPKERIVEKDVRRAAEALLSKPTEPSASEVIACGDQIIPLEGIRKVAAERMVQSFTTAPHFYLSVEVDAGLLLRMRESLVVSIEEKTGVRPTISDLLIKIAGQALQEHPEVNSVWIEGGVRRLETANVGLAVATDRGLVVPVFHNANRKSLSEITTERHAFTEKARAGRLSLQDLEGGSFTISNLGMFAVDQFNAIINPPQATILAVGRIKERPAVVDGHLTVRPTMFLTLSVDHRILDGAEAARFLARLVALIEEPYLLMPL
jgi:pyruvate dehydrogenase E2 component (dihydrolipoamide acetyltransferase)